MQPHNKLLVLAIVLAFLIRFWRLDSLPYPPDGDEVAFGYYGWSIVNFGTDEYRNFFPFSFTSIGDYKYPGVAYLNTLPAFFFGLSNITTRFVSALSGVLMVFLIYYLVKLLFSNNFIATTASFMAAFSPWSIIESRLGYESHVATVINLGALLLFLLVIERKRVKHRKLIIFGSFFLFFLSSVTYAASRIFIPSILFVLAILSFVTKGYLSLHRKTILVFFVSLTAIISLSLVSPNNRGRAMEILWRGISSEQKDRLAQLYVGAGISEIRIPARATWFFHNKYRVASFEFLERYLNHFSPQFLFLKGEATLQRIPDMGVLLFVDLILLPLGILTLFRSERIWQGVFILAWLIIAPISSSLTAGGAAINRASLMIPPFLIISSYGFYSIVNLFHAKYKKAIIFLIILIFSLSSLYSLNQIFIQKPVDRPWYKQTVNESLTREILRLKDSYKAVVTMDDDYIFFLFYGRISPEQFLQRSEILPIATEKWERVDRLDNIYFKMPMDCPKGGKLDVLYVCKGGDIPQNSSIIKSFYYLDGIPAYSLIEFYPLSQLPPTLPNLPQNLHYMVDVETNPNFPDGIIPDNFQSYW